MKTWLTLLGVAIACNAVAGHERTPIDVISGTGTGTFTGPMTGLKWFSFAAVAGQELRINSSISGSFVTASEQTQLTLYIANDNGIVEVGDSWMGQLPGGGTGTGLDMLMVKYSNATENELRLTLDRSGNYAVMLYITRPTTDPTPEYTVSISLTPLTKTQSASFHGTYGWFGSSGGGGGAIWNFDAFDPTNGKLNSATLTVNVHAIVTVTDRNPFTFTNNGYQSFALFSSDLYFIPISVNSEANYVETQRTEPRVLLPNEVATATFTFDRVFTFTLNSPEVLAWLMNENSRVMVNSHVYGSTGFGNGTNTETNYFTLAFNYTPVCPPRKAKAVAEIANGSVLLATMTDSGCGYTNPPVVLIRGGGGTGATARAIILNGEVASIQILDAGSGYTSRPTILIGSPPFVPKVGIKVRRVEVSQEVVLGWTYVLETSTNNLDWTATGPAFVAESESIATEFDVDAVGRFFRLRVVP